MPFQVSSRECLLITLRGFRGGVQIPVVPGSSRDRHPRSAAATVVIMVRHNALGDFLRARRELVTPAAAGLPGGGLRRVAGLRREEVAMLAGISAEYYLRLEQGRDRTPSAQVVDALARVLRLDAEGAAYLADLARPQPRRAKERSVEQVPVGTAMLLSTLNVPAFVVDRYRDVLAANPLAVSLSPLMRPGANRLVALFTDPQARAYHPDLDANIGNLVAQLRAEMGADTD